MPEEHSTCANTAQSSIPTTTNAAAKVYYGSDGGKTRSFCSTLEKTGRLGGIAAQLFRAQKASSRAKVYRGGVGKGFRLSYRDLAYDRKDKMIATLATMLDGGNCGMTWGWGRDDKNSVAPNVLYVDLPQGQVSFHCVQRHRGPDYPKSWDGEEASERRILEFCNAVMAQGESLVPPNEASPLSSRLADFDSETLVGSEPHQ